MFVLFSDKFEAPRCSVIQIEFPLLFRNLIDPLKIPLQILISLILERATRPVNLLLDADYVFN